KAIFAFSFCPAFELAALALIFVDGYAEAARIRNSQDRNFDDSAFADYVGKRRLQFGVARRGELMKISRAMEKKNTSRTFEGAEHQNDASVLFHMRDRFRTRAREVEIADPVRREDAKTVEPLGRQVEIALIRCRRDEENVLFGDPSRQIV